MSTFVGFDQHQFYPETGNDFLIESNLYDDIREEGEYIEVASIPSQYIDKPYFPVFIRYNPQDNETVFEHCPDFEPLKEEGLNWKLSVDTRDGGFVITGKDYSGEDFDRLIGCLSSIYEIKVNDSLYQELNYFYYEHPAKNQRGLLTRIPTDNFEVGDNLLQIRKVSILDQDSVKYNYQNVARIPFWYQLAQ